MAGTPELVIPIRLDPGKAAAALRQIGTAGAKAGDDVAGGMKHAETASHGLGSQIGSVAGALMGISALKGIATGIADSFNKTAKDVMEAAQQFQRLREAMQQVAALTGQQNQTKFTLAQVDKAQAAGLKPEEWRKAQEEFQSRAGAYLEGDQARMNQQQGEEYQQKIAEFAKARGIAPSEAMALGGGLLQFSEGQQDPAELMKRYGKVFKTLERAPTPVAQLLPQMSRVMSQGFSPEEAAQALAIMSEAMPGEEETGVENALKAFRNAQMKGEGEELGLKKGMSPMEMLEAGSRKLKERAGNGEDIDEMMKKYAPDLRERRGVLGFMNRGVGAEGFQRVRGYARDTADDFTEQAAREYQESDAGRQAKVDVALEAEKARMGARNDEVARRREIAEVELTRAGRFESVPIPERISGLVPGAEDTKTQQINRQMLRRARAQLGESSGLTDNAASLSQGATDEVMRALLKRIAESSERREKAAAAPSPLSAPPPAPPGRIP